MNIADQQTYRRHQHVNAPIGEILLTMLVFASMGAITWAIRGTSGWNGIDGTIVPGLTWGILWWYVCWRHGVDARSVPLWLGLGIALGGELGYGQYVGWIRGMFNAGDEVVPIAPWIGYAWFALCGIGWGAPGGIALGWALAGRKSLGVWLSRLAFPLGFALLARIAIQAWPWLFFPNWDLGVYGAKLDGAIDPAAAANTQENMIVAWLVIALASLVAWFISKRWPRPGWAARGISLAAVGTAIVLFWFFFEWLFFPEDQLGLFAGELGDHLGRTVYTNSQNAIVVGWWIGALLVAAIQRDRYTLVAGLVIGAGFGIGFPLSALWCLGYAYAPNLVDWWKMWELNAGFYLGLLYVVVLYWAIRQVDEKRDASRNDGFSRFRLWGETFSMALAALFAVHIMSREDFFTVGILLGIFYVVALILAMRSTMDGALDRQRGASFVYSLFLLVFIMAWGVSSQTGILLGLVEAKDVDQYSWPLARVALFAPAGILIVGVALLKTWQVLRNPGVTLPACTAAPPISARLTDLMTFTGLVGAASIWPSKISVLYALFLGLALFAFNRLNRRFDSADTLRS
jgi:hypothetical protein